MNFSRRCRMNFSRRCFLFVLCAMLVCMAQTVQASEGHNMQEKWIEELLDELNLAETDEVLKQELPERLTFSSLVSALTKDGGEGMSLRLLADYLLDLFFYEIAAAKPIFLQILCVCLLFALFGRLLVTRFGYVNDLSFFAVYTGIMMLLLNSFLLVNNVVEAGMEKMLSFMTAFVPVYAAALLFSGNMTTAGVFYEMAFALIYILELLMRVLFVPGVHIFVLLVMMDNLFEEAKLSKLADMIESGIRTALKMSLAAVVGLGVVQSLIAPARDRISANSVFQTLQAVPGLGNTFGAAGEILVGCGILIRNSVGTAALVVLVVLSAAPAVSVACFHVMYRLVGACLQPFCDKRISQCVHEVGRACGLYLKIVGSAMLLLFITISMISASASFIY